MAENVTITYSKHYFSSLTKLPSDVQDDFTKAMFVFMMNPNHNSLYVKPWKSNGKKTDVFEFRVSIKYRCLFLDLGHKHYMFILACHHNETNNGNKIKGFLGSNFDYETGELIPDESRIDELVAEIEASGASKDQKEKMLFDDLSEKQLRYMKIPAELFPIIRKIPDIETLKALEGELAEDTYSALLWYAEGDPIDDIVQTLYGENAIHTDSDQDSVQVKPYKSNSFITIDSISEYEKILSGSLEAWRIFLHPEQRYLSEKNFNGSAKVTGGAGTGKTVTAMHRAKWIAEHLKNGQKVFFTTFTKNLTEDIRVNLKKLCPDSTVFNRIEIDNIDNWAVFYFQQFNKEDTVEYNLNDVWRKAYNNNPDPELPLTFFIEEWERVLVQNEAFTFESYLASSRRGRQQLPGGRKKKEAIWPVFQAFMDLCKERHILDIQRIMIACIKHLQTRTTPLYESVIVDEGQDFSPTAYKLLRAMTSPEHPNDLFIVGDSRQRIYNHKQSLSSYNIKVRGRSYRLRLNYRTTDEIRASALHILDGIRFDDMDGNEDPVSGYRSMIHGNAPVFKSFPDEIQELEFIHSQIEQYRAQEVQLKDICLVSASKRQCDYYKDKLEKQGIPCVTLERERDDRSVDGVRISTMYRVKGLEFNHILIAGVDSRHFPQKYLFTPDMSDLQREEVLKTNRCLLYVSMTRAKMTVVVTAPGKMTELIPADLVE